MQISVNGHDTFVATGGRDFDPALPVVVMIHGAGFDNSTWSLQSRWLAHHGHAVLAPEQGYVETLFGRDRKSVV